jgi:lysozyme family protein
VKADGFIGPVTLAAAQKADANELGAKLISRRSTFYRNIAKGRKAKFLKGWLNRNRALAELVCPEASPRRVARDKSPGCQPCTATP